MDVIHIIAIVVAAGLGGYLTLALLKPEWFQ